MAESFVSTLKADLAPLPVDHHEATRTAIFEYLEAFYRRCRPRSSLGYQSPVDYEEATLRGVTVA